MEAPHPSSPRDDTDVSFLVAATPVPQPRQKFGAVVMGGKPKAVGYTDSKHKIHEFKFAVRQAAELAMHERELLSGPLHLGISFVLPRPSSMTRKKGNNPRVYCDKKRGDLDNYIKSLQDACNGICYHDDSQIASLFATKQYAAAHESAHTVVLLQRLTEEPES